MGQEQRIAFIHYLRGIAAVSVMASHLCLWFWAATPQVATGIGLPAVTEIRNEALIWPTAILGQIGMGLFFAISGFVIPLSLESTSRLRFLVSRFFRLWPVYVAGLLIVAGVLFLASQYFGVPVKFDRDALLSHLWLGFRSYLNVRDIVGVTWSLEVEIHFYLLCALVAPLLQTRIITTIFATAGICASLVVWMKFIGLLQTEVWANSLSLPLVIIPFMFLGTILYAHYRAKISISKTVVACLAMFLIYAGLRAATYSSFMSSAILTYLVGFLVFVASYKFARNWRNPIAYFLADISYPLYVIHAIGGYAIMTVGLDLGWHPVVCVLAAVTFALGIATALHFLVERPTIALGRRFSKQFLVNR